MKLNLYYLLLFITVNGWCASCHKPKEVSPPASEPPVEDTIPSPQPPPIDNQKNDFVLFHLVRYNHTPSDLMPYLHPTKIANEKMLLNDDGTPNISAIKSFAQTCKPHIPVTLDLETWSYSKSNIENTVDHFLTVIEAFKSVNLKSPIGFYGIPPKQVYQWKHIDPVSNPSGHANWLAINDQLAPVGARVDLFLPSFYAYDPDTTSWRKMVDATVAAIRKYKPRRPIYAYIWPQYHQGQTQYNLQYIDTAIWRYQLQVLYDRVDGCIIWTSNKDSQGNTISWNPNMPWWQTTKSFLVNKGLVSPFVMDSLYANQVGDSVQVRWATSADATSNYFVVQRSADAKIFKDVSGHISPISTHYTENGYTSADKNPLDGTNYYRILIVDKQGKKNFSDTIKTNYHTPEEAIGNKEVQMQFQSQEQWGTQKNTLHLMVSTDFDGDYTPAGVNKATWTEISDKATLSTGQKDYVSSGTIDLTPYVKKGEPFYFAFHFKSDGSGTQRTWDISDFQIELKNASAVIANAASGGWEAVQISGAYKWFLGGENGNILHIQGGTKDDPLSNNWFITKNLNAKK